LYGAMSRLRSPTYALSPRSQPLTVLQRGRVLAEQSNVRSHTQVRTAVPDDVAAVVADTLHLQKHRQTSTYSVSVGIFRYHRTLSWNIDGSIN
jgi:hypothetical protein